MELLFAAVVPRVHETRMVPPIPSSPPCYSLGKKIQRTRLEQSVELPPCSLVLEKQQKKNPQDITSSSALKSERLGEGGWVCSLPFTSLGVGLHALITEALRGAHAEEGTPNPPRLNAGCAQPPWAHRFPISTWLGGWRQLGAAHSDRPHPVGHSDPPSLSPTF